MGGDVARTSGGGCFGFACSAVTSENCWEREEKGITERVIAYCSRTEGGEVRGSM